MGIPGSTNPLMLVQQQASGYNIERSLRFNSSDSGFCARTPSSAGNRRTFTWSGWVKLGTNFASRRMLFGGGTVANSIPNTYLEITDSAQLGFDSVDPPSLTNVARVRTTAVLRDPSAWYHILFSVDTTQSTAANRVKIYINGVEQTSYSSTTYPSQNYDCGINSTQVQTIGAYPEAAYRSGLYFDGYIADCIFVDGSALTPSSFTEVSATTGQLVPKAYTGSFGTNGFWLKFSDNSAATATTLGKDYSSNGNNWTPNNLTATELYGRLYRQSTGTATSAFSSANLVGNFPASASGNYIYDAELSTSVTTATFGYLYAFGGVEVLVSNDGTNWTSKGVQTNAYTTVTNSTPFKYVRWFIAQSWMHGITNNPANIDSTVDTPTSYGTDTGAGGEVRGNYATLNPLNAAHTYSNGNLDVTTSTSSYAALPAATSSIGVTSGKWYVEYSPTSLAAGCILGVTSTPSAFAYPGGDASSYGYYSVNGNKYNNASGSSYGNSFTTGDVIGIALDLDNGKIWFSKNGTWQASGNPASGTNAAYTGLSGTYFIAVAKDTTGSTTTAGTFNFGQRPFAYTAPSGFKSLSDTSLPAPVVAKGSSAFDALLYTGNGASRSITGLSFNPDLVWIKSRSGAYTHGLNDAVRGAGKFLYSDQTSAEGNYPTDFASFDSNGFSLGTGSGLVTNENNSTYVAWCWDAGTSTVTDNTGSIQSTRRTNASAGFSIVTYTGNATAGATVGHGLGVAPALIINKQRSGTNNWWTYHASLGATKYLVLDGTNAVGTANTVWNDTAPTSTVFSIGVTGVTNTNSATYVTYCFAPVVGYSSMGAYAGNGSSDGPMVFTNHRPRWVLIKAYDATATWVIFDAARNTYNVMNAGLYPNSSGAEETIWGIDFLSNGFKLRTTNGGVNQSGLNYIYCSFAESPFAYSRAR